MISADVVFLQVSPYSWFGFTNTIRFRPLLEAYGVSVEIIPFFLGGARDSVGNPFTPTPQAKEAFAKQDSEMTGQLLGLKVVRPKIFPILSLFVSFPMSECENRNSD
jgi:glutathione S-transferase kappa 1